MRGRACVQKRPSIRAAAAIAAEAGSGIFRVPGVACAFKAATGRRGRADRSPDHGGHAGVRSRESRRSLRPHHLLPAAADHHPHRIVGESGSLLFILCALVLITYSPSNISDIYFDRLVIKKKKKKRIIKIADISVKMTKKSKID